MFTSIRKYKVRRGTAAELARRVQEGLTDPGSDHADGAQALRVANREVARASAEFQRALRAFAEVVMRHCRKLE